MTTKVTGIKHMALRATLRGGGYYPGRFNSTQFTMGGCVVQPGERVVQAAHFASCPACLTANRARLKARRDQSGVGRGEQGGPLGPAVPVVRVARQREKVSM